MAGIEKLRLGRSAKVEHRRTFAYPIQPGATFLANLTCMALFVAPQESLFIMEKKILFEKHSWGSFLPLPHPAYNQPIVPQHCCHAKLHYKFGLWDNKRQISDRRRNLPILISTSPSHQDMLWTGKFYSVKLSNIANYSVQTINRVHTLKEGRELMCSSVTEPDSENKARVSIT